MLSSAILASCLLASSPAPQGQEPEVAVHAISDISQSFTFYMDGRFYRQYLQGVGRDARNWGSLSKLDLSNINLLLLTAGDHHVPYDEGALENIKDFVTTGGTVLMMADGAERQPPGAAVVEMFGARLATERAQEPLRGIGPLIGANITYRGGRTLDLDERWNTLVQDDAQRPILASRQFGEGYVLLGSRGLFGQRPDASDPINARWIRPLLVDLASHKTIDSQRRPRGNWAELTKQIGPLTLEFHDGTARFADKIAEEYLLVRPHLVEITGVEPSPGMIKKLLILPTGGGGFSSGERIAIGAWWGDYPNQRYPMVEIISHEAGHSWVLPYAEPLWNEPIATYLGIQVGKRLGMPEAQQTLDRAIANARKHDQVLNKVDPLAKEAPNSLVWGKSYFVFEELERTHGPGALAKYFRTKRRVLQPGRKGYSMDDCVAVWSLAVGEDLFPWFRSLAFSVDRANTDLPAPQ